MQLVKPSLELEEAYYAFAADWVCHQEPLYPFAVRLEQKTYGDWLKRIQRQERGGAFHKVPSNTYFLLDEQGCVVGAISIRHRLNKKLRVVGGHMGYGVAPSERGKGYATKMLELALPITRELGINPALLTCRKDNLGSIRAIEKNGGVLQGELTVNELRIQHYLL